MTQRFVLCQRPGCGAVRPVQRKRDLGLGKYCSRKCAALVNQNVTFDRAANARGGRARAAQLRAKLLADLAGKSPLEAFRLGYARGLSSKHRQLTRQRIQAMREFQRRTA